MRRRLLTILSAVSLLLCIAAVALWVRSYFIYDIVHHGTGVKQQAGELIVKDWYFESASGSVDVRHYVTHARWGQIGNPTPAGWQWIKGNPRFVWRPQPKRLGFAYHAERSPPAGINYGDVRYLRCPLWAIFVPAGIGPLLCFVHNRRAAARLRRDRGLCDRCGYDLTGNVSGVCPECGMKIALADAPAPAAPWPVITNEVDLSR